MENNKKDELFLNLNNQYQEFPIDEFIILNLISFNQIYYYNFQNNAKIMDF